MDSQRKSISLTKDRDRDRPKVREAYPVYSNNTDSEELERQEYRNSPVRPAFERPDDSYNRYANDPLPGGGYASPQMQKDNQAQDDDLSRYYNYESNYREAPQMPKPAPQVTQPPVQRYQQPPVQNKAVQRTTKFCKYCGQKIAVDAVVCTHCGRQVEMLKREGDVPSNNVPSRVKQERISPKDKRTALILAVIGLTGCGGLQRFYAGKIMSGLLFLFTGGLLGFGTVWDIIRIATDTFEDSEGRIIKK